MKRTKNLSVLLLLTVFICGCSKPIKMDDKVIHVDVSTSQSLNMADIVKHISIIPLETNDSCLVKRISSMQVRDGKIYINNDRNEAMVFDENGRFIHSTRHCMGQGDNDYIWAPSVYIDKKGTISIYELFSPRIREYDDALNLIHSYNVNLPDSTRSSQELRRHAQLTDDVYVMYDPKYIYFYSVGQEKILRTIHFDYPDLIGITSHFRLADYGDSFFYSHPYSCDTLYCIDRKDLSMRPAVIYDFGGKSVNVNELPQDMPMEYYMTYLMKTDRIVVLDKFHWTDRDICYFLENQNSYLAYQKDGKITVYRQDKKDYVFPVPSAIEGNRFYYAAMPDDVHKFIDLKLVDEQNQKYLHGLCADDNQVLVCYDLK